MLCFKKVDCLTAMSSCRTGTPKNWHVGGLQGKLPQQEVGVAVKSSTCGSMIHRGTAACQSLPAAGGELHCN